MSHPRRLFADDAFDPGKFPKFIGTEARCQEDIFKPHLVNDFAYLFSFDAISQIGIDIEGRKWFTFTEMTWGKLRSSVTSDIHLNALS